ncbi:hypothetical protein GCM10010885_13990 [Alicyclobacillus cellulosilyticus]|uniref:Glycosyltransferase involved in cell wall biosynthesis n=1 Tax=Alicyclobacillus cellulosilyticus TaxID=1003997 RepID=A0A917KA44_9BACL|nr:glycosyltransferase family 4 protein [Alicyclobacillus cellulosilyticus]GGJ06005.1 hypothetical protein GCM10010885_13990 [Alicyclobacillus cellulosilyticus]
MMRVAYVSTFPPRRCGIATFTHHLRQAVAAAAGRPAVDPVIVMTDASVAAPEDESLFWPLERDERSMYAELARRVNESDVAAVSLQHEFGIFGGEAGEYILDFIRALRKPLITTFHTVFQRPEAPYAPVQREIAQQSDRIVVMNRHAVAYLCDAFGIPASKVVFIPHGTPAPREADREACRREFGWVGRRVVLTFGLLNRGKGIETVLQALPEVAERIPNVLYVVAGLTHPEVKKREGEAYRESLLAMVEQLGLSNHVEMINRYIDDDELVRLLTACDLYVTPYPGMQQITSGTLAYAVGLGRPVLTTPYDYARDLLRGFEELLIPFGDTRLWAEKMAALLADDAARQDWSARIARIGRTMHWPQIGLAHWQLYAEAAAPGRLGRAAADAPQQAGVSSVVSITG